MPAYAETVAPVQPAPAASSPAASSPAVQPTTTPAPTTDGGAKATYIVRFRAGHKMASSGTAATLLERRAARPLATLSSSVVRLTAAEAGALASDPSVAYVQKSTPVRAADAGTPWNLDRLDQSSLPLDDHYSPNQTGAGVKVYVVDTGIDASTPDLAGRVAAGRSFLAGDSSTNDCNGHGTHVASTAGGTTYGVAKGITLVPVRVLDCNGSGSSVDVVRALDWIASVHRAHTPAVVNLSLAGARDQALDDAVKRVVKDGVTVVAAAGNDGADACGISPAAVPAALTVAASDAADQRASFSNRGSCVDLYAPGVNVLSAEAGGGASSMSGTSAASPHVAGVAAMILAAHHRWSPKAVAARILQLSLSGRIGGNPSGTPNRLLNIAPTVSAVSHATAQLGGRQVVTISGQRFLGVRKVLLGAQPAPRVKVRSGSSIKVTTPARVLTAGTSLSSGSVAVRVVTELSMSNHDMAFAFWPAPVVAGMSVHAGPTGGGTEVTIEGTGFTGATAVKFGKRKASGFTVVSDSVIRAVSPSGKKGTVDVRVSRGSASSPRVSDDRFTYGRTPSVRGLSMTQGPTTGGSRLVITGRNFSGVTAVLFGDQAATGLKVSSTRRLTVTVPAGAAGTVDVRVVNRFGVSATSSKTAFSFR